MHKSPVAQVADKYIEGMPHVTPIENFDRFTSQEHLLWMLTQISSDCMPETKANRWLGFIQAHLAIHGLIDIKSERESTRGIFNGA